MEYLRFQSQILRLALSVRLILIKNDTLVDYSSLLVFQLKYLTVDSRVDLHKLRSRSNRSAIDDLLPCKRSILILTQYIFRCIVVQSLKFILRFLAFDLLDVLCCFLSNRRQNVQIVQQFTYGDMGVHQILSTHFIIKDLVGFLVQCYN